MTSNVKFLLIDILIDSIHLEALSLCIPKYHLMHDRFGVNYMRAQQVAYNVC